MKNITRLTAGQTLALVENLSLADLNGRSVRIATGVDTNGHFIMWDAGQGWTAPQYGDPTGADCSDPACPYTEHGVSAQNRRSSEFYAEHPRG